MAATIDIDPLKILKKSRTNETENQQKIKNSQSLTQDLLILKKNSVLRLVHFSKILRPKVTVNT